MKRTALVLFSALLFVVCAVLQTYMLVSRIADYLSATANRYNLLAVTGFMAENGVDQLTIMVDTVHGSENRFEEAYRIRYCGWRSDAGDPCVANVMFMGTSTDNPDDMWFGIDGWVPPTPGYKSAVFGKIQPIDGIIDGALWRSSSREMFVRGQEEPGNGSPGKWQAKYEKGLAMVSWAIRQTPQQSLLIERESDGQVTTELTIWVCAVRDGR